MLDKTQGIILRQIKYNDQSNIVTAFTRDFGKVSFLVYGINSKKKGKIYRAILQPLYLVNLNFYHKQSSQLFKIKEINLAYSYQTIPISFEKKAILLFLSEILNKVLIERMPDKEFFDFVWNSLIMFDLERENFVNFHLLFLISILKYLGIQPNNNFSSQNQYFSIQEGEFLSVYKSTLSLNAEQSKVFSKLLELSITDFDKVKLSRNLRNSLIRALLNYFSYHIENFGNVNSFEIFQEIFSE